MPRARRPRTSPPSASPINARPPWSGTARPASRSPPRSSGRTPAPRTTSTRSRRTAVLAASSEQTGLPLATYFSATKIAWILDNVDGARARAEAGELAFGTTDSWVLWNLTGGPDGGVHATDVTNASRTLLMDLRTLAWDDALLEAFGIPRAAAARDPQLVRGVRRGRGLHSPAPECRSPASWATSRPRRSGRRRSVPASRRTPTAPGNFLIFNTGTEITALRERPDHDGRLPARRRRPGVRARGLDRGDRLAHPVAARQPRHHREGCRTSRSSRSRSTTTAACTSCRRSRGSSPRTGDRTPAASSSASPASRTRATSRAPRSSRPRSRPARCSMPSTPTPGSPLAELRVDGGMVANDALMQFQADILGVPVVRPAVIETTALGAAYAAGLAVGLLEGPRRAARQLAGGHALGAAARCRRIARSACASGSGRSRGRSTGSSDVTSESGQAFVAAIQASSFAIAAPESTASAARAMLLAEPGPDVRLGQRGILRQLPRHESGRGVQQHDVAHRALLARQRAARDGGVGGRVAAAQVVDRRARRARDRRGRGRARAPRRARSPRRGCGRWSRARRARRRRGTPGRSRRGSGRRRRTAAPCRAGRRPPPTPRGAPGCRAGRGS